mmetsp:Transcript_34129/g.59557  ORF Transcript_34129/g.59557 Transcript_34129/m.59557 type:complete len:122 (-) Transcript_34129:3979-4344(-)
MSEIDIHDSSNSELIGELVHGFNHRISRLDARLTGAVKKTPERDLRFTPTKASSPDSDLNRSPEGGNLDAKLLGLSQRSKQVWTQDSKRMVANYLGIRLLACFQRTRLIDSAQKKATRGEL